MSEQVKNNNKESMICLTPKLSQNFFDYRLLSILRKKGSERLNKILKEDF